MESNQAARQYALALKNLRVCEGTLLNAHGIALTEQETSADVPPAERAKPAVDDAQGNDPRS